MLPSLRLARPLLALVVLALALAFSLIILASCGTQAPTPSPTLASTPILDPLTVSSHSPAAGAVKADPATKVTVAFSAAASGVSSSSFVLRDATTNVAIAASVSYNASNYVATLDPTLTLTAGHQYSVELSSSIQNLAGNPLTASNWTFLTAPSVLSQTYTLKGTVNYETSYLYMTETLDWTNRSSNNVTDLNLSVIPAYVKAFTLTGPVTADGLSTQVSWSDTINLNVAFAKPLLPGATGHIVIPFRLYAGTYSGAFGSRFGRYNGVMQFGEWFPVWSPAHSFSAIGEPQVTYNAEKISLDLTSTSNLGVNAVAASGTPKILAGNHWVFEASNVKDFAFAISRDYHLYTGTVNGTQVRAYSIKASGSTMLARAVAALAKYASWYGPYDYPTFSIAEVGSSGFSMEFPQMVFLGKDMAANNEVLWHEVAHQWWYGIIGNDQMSDPFLDEGMADFSDRLALSLSTDNLSKGDIDSSIEKFSKWGGSSGYLETIYHRGAQAMEAIRLRMGNTSFFAALRAFVAQYRYANVTTFELLDYLEAYNSTDIGDLIQTYTSR